MYACRDESRTKAHADSLMKGAHDHVQKAQNVTQSFQWNSDDIGALQPSALAGAFDELVRASFARM